MEKVNGSLTFNLKPRLKKKTYFDTEIRNYTFNLFKTNHRQK